MSNRGNKLDTRKKAGYTERKAMDALIMENSVDTGMTDVLDGVTYTVRKFNPGWTFAKVAKAVHPRLTSHMAQYVAREIGVLMKSPPQPAEIDDIKRLEEMIVNAVGMIKAQNVKIDLLKGELQDLIRRLGGE